MSPNYIGSGIHALAATTEGAKMSKLQQLGRYLGQHAKAYAGLVGSLGTLAVTLFPSDDRVQAIGGGLGVLSTFLLVHITPNAPASQKADADQAAAHVLGQLVHTPDARLEFLVEKLGTMMETATAATVAAASVVAAQNGAAPPPAPETPAEAPEAGSDDLAHAQEAPEPTPPAPDPDPSVPDVPGVLEGEAQPTQDMPRVQPVPDDAPNESAAVGQVTETVPSDEPPLLG